jgi:hypothetical protein
LRRARRRKPPAFRSRHARGSTLVEFTVLALPLLFAALLAVEGVRWQTARAVCQLALLEAARAGSTGHLRPAALKAAFESAMLPLFVPPGDHATPQARMRAAWHGIRQRIGLPAWRMAQLSPSAAHFLAYADARLQVPGAAGHRIIRNDYQAEQHRSGGHAGGAGTIFQANTLRLELTYLYQPLFPPLTALLRSLGDAHGSYGQQAMARGGLLPIVVDVTLEMQSHPVQWNTPLEADG